MNDLKGIIEDCNKSDLVSDRVIKKIIEIIGQEEWQDLHDENNDVCTTMGELIITLKGIANLEKENAELKEELKDANKKVVHLACNQNKDLKRKINKAIEIIKNLMVFAEMDDREYEKEYKEAKQFLNEVEK